MLRACFNVDAAFESPSACIFCYTFWKYAKLWKLTQLNAPVLSHEANASSEVILMTL